MIRVKYSFESQARGLGLKLNKDGTGYADTERHGYLCGISPDGRLLIANIETGEFHFVSPEDARRESDNNSADLGAIHSLLKSIDEKLGRMELKNE